MVTGGRAAELALRCKYGGFDAGAIEVEPDLARALDRALELTPPGGELVRLPTYTAMLELQRIVAERGYARAATGSGRREGSRSATSIPDYLNIYADRGNIAVLERRAAWRGIELSVEAIGVGDAVEPGRHDLFYVGGGQDREQALIAPDLAAKGEALREAVGGRRGRPRRLRRLPAARARFYRDVSGAEQPGAGVLPLYTVAGETRMIGDCLLECELEPGVRRTLAGFENHAGRTYLDEGAEPLGRVIAGFGNDGESGFEGCRVGRALGTYLHGPLLPRNPWLADWLLAQALGHAAGGEPPAARAARRRARGAGARRLGLPGPSARRQVTDCS